MNALRLTWWSMVCCFSMAIAAEAQTPSERPNVILVMSDDQGYGDFGATGNRVIETPNLDAMAARSATMKTFYVSPVCSPTRASLMTGRYNYRTRCIDTFVGRSMMDPEEVTIAEVLRDAGYRTGIFGKWHLGDCYPMRPQDQGFDESLVLRGGGLAQPADPPENERRYTDPILFHNGEQVATKGYCTDVYFDAALDFITGAAGAEKPFFTYIATNAPHGPFHDVPEHLYKAYLDHDLASLITDDVNETQQKTMADTLARIAAMITNVDQNMARLFAKLDELSLTENTVVIFLTDNGPNTRRYVRPFRGMKSEVYEGGVRTPFWMQWPARLKADASSEVPAAHIDVMPTILDACGVAVPKGLKLDGRSFLPLLEGKEVRWPERTLVLQTHRGDVPVRYHQFMIRDNRWKLVNPSGFGKESLKGAPAFQLYDLLADPGERNDLAAAEPDTVARLKTAYDAWFDDVSSTREDNYAPPRIVIGVPEAPTTVLTRQDWRGGTWQRDSIGHWLVNVAEEGEYTVTVRFDPDPEKGRLEIRCGETTVARLIGANDTTAAIEGVKLAPGDALFEATLHHGDRKRGVYQITITR